MGTDEDYMQELARQLTPEHMKQYWHTLGKFVWMFAMVEMNVKDALWTLAGLDPKVARAVLSGVKIDAAIGLMRRIGEAQNWPEERTKEFEYVFAQLLVINKFRNDILHYGGLLIGDTVTVSNKFVAHVDNRIHEHKATIPEIEAMIHDLGSIQSWFVLLVWSNELTPKTRSLVEAIRGSSWRYKPPSQESGRRKSRQNARKQRRRPEPSRG